MFSRVGCVEVFNAETQGGLTTEYTEYTEEKMVDI